MKHAKSPSSRFDRMQSWKSDLLASLVVFLVALPLCMDIAIASGVPPEKAAGVGIISGIIGGLIVSPLAGCPLQVTGPAAGLAVIVGQIISEKGFAALGMIIMVAGVIQLLAGALRLGQWFRAVSPAIIHGMLAGIGVLIFAGQFHVMVDDKPPGSGKEFGGIINLATIPQAVFKGLNEQAHQPAAIVGIVTIIAIMGWTALCPKRLKFLPAPLIGVFVGTILGVVLQRYDMGPQAIQIPDTFASAVSLPSWSDLWLLVDRSILMAGLTVAFIASAESLLTASAVDSMQQHAPRTNYDRELAAQGVGNVLCGILGAIPVTGVIVRSAANVQSGAQTRATATLHGVWLLVFAAAFPFVLRLVPVASLAAILVYTGCKLANPKIVRTLWEYGKGEAAVYVATLAAVVIFDLLTGIVVGLILAVLQLIQQFTRLRIRIASEPDRNRTTLYLSGAATFLRLPKLAATLQEVPPSTELHVHIEELGHIDHACLDLLMNWEKQHEATGGSLVIDWDTLTAKFRQFKTSNGNGNRSNGKPPESSAEKRAPAHYRHGDRDDERKSIPA